MKSVKIWTLWALTVLLLCCLIPREAQAATYGDLAYVISNGEVTITDCDTSVSGTVEIPDSIEGYPVTAIGDYAFYSCTKLTGVTIPDSVTVVGKYAFEYCYGLTSVTIPDNVVSIGMCAFHNCTSLTSVTIGGGVESIGASAFNFCLKLKKISVSSNNASFSSDSYGVLFNKDQSILIQAPGALSGSYSVPKTVLTIDDYAFYYCQSLSSITIGTAVTSIGAGAFEYCSGLTSLTIPDQVTSIGSRAFASCSGLTSVSIGTGVTSIGNDAFTSCSKLDAVYVTDIAAWCNISFASNYANPLYLANKLYLNKKLVTELVIPVGVAGIGKMAFFKCTALTSVAIPASVTTIGQAAFYGCDAIGAVTYCGTEEEWTAIAIGSSNTTLTSAAISYHRYSAATCLAPETCALCGKTVGETVDHSWKNNTCTVCGISGGTCGDDLTWILDKAGNLSISGSGAMYDYSLYSNSPWSDSSKVKSVSLEDGITDIGNYAFYFCTGISSITIPESVAEIGDAAFYCCTKLTSVDIPDGVTVIGKGAFYNTAITSVTVPGTVSTVGYSAFEGCDALTSVTLCDGVTKIDCEAFQYCGALSELVLPDSLTAINPWAFEYCTGLTELTLPDNVYLIGESAFGHCTGLTAVTLGSSLATVGQWGFYNCLALTTVNYCGTDAQWEALAISSGNDELLAADRIYHSFADGICTVCGGMQTNYIVLTANTRANWIITCDLYVDLNGFDLRGTVKTNGFSIFGMDSTTDGYTCDSIGYFTCTDENGQAIVPVSHFKSDISGSVKRYMAVKDDNSYSFHRFYLGVTHMSLKPTTAGVGYKAVFWGDEMVAANLNSFGFTMCLEGNEPVTVSKDGESFVSGKVITLRVNNFDVKNYGETALTASVMFKLADGTVIESIAATMTFRGLMEQLNTAAGSLTEEQLTAIAAMIEKHAIIKQWATENLY